MQIAALMKSVDDVVARCVDAVPIGELVAYNAGYRRYASDPFQGFVGDERPRFAQALSLVDGLAPSRVADLGCFIPYMPVALARLGWEVTAVDRYSLYGDGMRTAIQDVAAAEGFRLFDLDIVKDPLSSLHGHDLILLMAVVEHLNGSPARLLTEIRKTLNPGGKLLFEVPNIAELGRRISFARGRSPLPDYESYLASGYPFTGHNREMTVAEVRMLMESAGFRIDTLKNFDYSPVPSGRKARLVRAARRLVPNSRETIMALCTPVTPSGAA